ncbi:interferon a3-like [Epinephelus lanceolatus]
MSRNAGRSHFQFHFEGSAFLLRHARAADCSKINLIKTMASNSTNSTEDAEVDDTVSFPNHLYSQASKASAEDKVAFTVQILEEMVALLEGGYSSASWEENTEENFLSVVSRQAVGLRSCTVHHKESKKLHVYFKRLSSHVLEQMGHSAEAWELIRREMKSHLKRVDQLLLSNQHLSVTFIYLFIYLSIY